MKHPAGFTPPHFPAPARRRPLRFLRETPPPGILRQSGEVLRSITPASLMEDVYQDLLDYHSLLAPGEVLFCDDWGWSGVRAAAERFAAEQV